MRPLFHSYRQNGISRTELSSSSQSRKKSGGSGTAWYLKERFWPSLSARPEVTCLFIEFLLVLRKLPSFQWVVILAIVC